MCVSFVCTWSYVLSVFCVWSKGFLWPAGRSKWHGCLCCSVGRDTGFTLWPPIQQCLSKQTATSIRYISYTAPISTNERWECNQWKDVCWYVVCVWQVTLWVSLASMRTCRTWTLSRNSWIPSWRTTTRPLDWYPWAWCFSGTPFNTVVSQRNTH